MHGFPGRWLWRGALAVSVLGLLLVGDEAKALKLMPLQIEESSGAFEVSNNSKRFVRVQVHVYPARKLDNGRTTADLTPLPAETVQRLIRLRPSSFRLGANARRIVNYKVLDASTNSEFFVCAETLAAIGKIRICSRWQPSS